MARYGPIVCHCSAGVGRTGTFIAIDRVVEQLKHAERVQQTKSVHRRPHTSASVTFPSSSAAMLKPFDIAEMLLDIYGDITIDVFGIVSDMRRERCTMVQTEQQYHFIYQCIANVLESRCGITDKSSSRSSRDSAQFAAHDVDNHFGLYAASTKVSFASVGGLTVDAGNRQRATSGVLSSLGFYPAVPSESHSRQRFSSGGN